MRRFLLAGNTAIVDDVYMLFFLHGPLILDNNVLGSCGFLQFIRL